MYKSQIFMIAVDKLIPHPDNPRKEIGDVTELAESIKVNGILQNLTVVEENDGKYLVIIGHRRLAASKVAGLNFVPCVVAEMTHEEQITTMLTENMQRTDLTVYEQAQTFQQLSLDFGLSIQEISEKSGFSETTVRRRIKMADLDPNELKKACGRGATLEEIAKLEDIKDPTEKAELLKSVGTQNFKNNLKSALERQRTKEKMAKWLEQIKAFATKISATTWENESSMAIIGEEKVPVTRIVGYGYWSKDVDVPTPDDADSVKYYYKVGNEQIDLYKELIITDEEKEDQRKKKEEQQKNEDEWKQLQAITARHRELRRDFIEEYTAAKRNRDTILRYLADAIMSNHVSTSNYYMRPDMCEFCHMIHIPFDREERKPSQGDWNNLKVENVEKILLTVAYWYLEGKNGYVSHEWDTTLQRYVNRKKDNQSLDSLYDMLEALGYECSDEEKQMREGTHELIFKEA